MKTALYNWMLNWKIYIIKKLSMQNINNNVIVKNVMGMVQKMEVNQNVANVMELAKLELQDKWET